MLTQIDGQLYIWRGKTKADQRRPLGRPHAWPRSPMFRPLPSPAFAAWLKQFVQRRSARPSKTASASPTRVAQSEIVETMHLGIPTKREGNTNGRPPTDQEPQDTSVAGRRRRRNRRLRRVFWSCNMLHDKKIAARSIDTKRFLPAQRELHQLTR
jgi:hypothetical protein